MKQAKHFIISLIILGLPLTALSQWSTNGSKIYYNSGNVGVGTSNPSAKFQVNGEIHINRDYPYIQFNSTYWGFASFIQNGVTLGAAANGDYMVFYNGGSKGFNFRQGSYDALTILPNGNVGIGKSDPYSGSRLHVKAPNSGAYSFMVEASTNDRVTGLSHDGNVGVISVSYLSSGGYSPLEFRTENLARMSISTGGDVGIGTTTPDSKLTVKGIIHAEEVKVDLAVPGPDYVFEENYPLLSLEDTKSYITENKHLPGIPSSDEMQANGINLLEMNMKLLEKVEELTLHLIEMKRENEEQQKQLDKLLTKSGL